MSTHNSHQEAEFIDYMTEIRNYDGLRNYANLVVTGMAKNPGSDKLIERLIPWADRCEDCHSVIGKNLGCHGCREMLDAFVLRTKAAFNRNKKVTYCCAEFPRKPWWERESA